MMMMWPYNELILSNHVSIVNDIYILNNVNHSLGH